MNNSQSKKRGRKAAQKTESPEPALEAEDIELGDPTLNIECEVDILGPDQAAEAAYKEAVSNAQPIVPTVPQQENLAQRKAANTWIRQHLSGLFTANQVDAAVAKVIGVELATIRRWKVAFGWSKRLENTRLEERAEEQVVLYLKNEKMENDSIDTILKYINYVKSLPAGEILPGHVTAMMKLVDFAQKNKDKLKPPDPMTTATGISLTIQND